MSNSNLSIQKDSHDGLFLRKGSSEIEFVLGTANSELARITLPDCPDVDSYAAVVLRTAHLDHSVNFDEWLEKLLPSGNYFLGRCSPPKPEAELIQFGQAMVPTEGRMAVLFDIDSYYGVGVVGGDNRFAGAVFLTLCIPDFLLDTSVRGVLLIQIASTESDLCHVIVPRNNLFCLCIHDTFKSGAEVAANLREWYVEDGSLDITKIIEGLTPIN